MGRIQVLDDALADQIAAGEVVERPASAVKELLENALDAGATAVTVELAEGGVKRLRVVDDGHGMDPDDAVLALRRHATSKLRTTADLVRIATLGFRGEALPSIAAVSRFRLRTREPAALGATLVVVEGGGAPQVSQTAGPPGTEVLVEDLFFNIPARRKFLKQEATEASHVLEVVQRLALGAPTVAFRLIKDDKVVLDLPRHRALADRVAALFGAKLASDLKPARVDGSLGLSGLVGSAETARSTPRHYYTFINGRFVRDRVIMAAIQSAYGHRLPRGQHPFVVLHLTLPVDLLDVNVHPAKTEVRFADTRIIHRLVARGVDAALEGLVDAPVPAGGRVYTLALAPADGGEDGPSHLPTGPTGRSPQASLPGEGPPDGGPPDGGPPDEGPPDEGRATEHRVVALPDAGLPAPPASLQYRTPPRPGPDRPWTRPESRPDSRPETLTLALTGGPHAAGPHTAGPVTRLEYVPADGAAALALDRLPVLGEIGGLLLLKAENAILGVDIEAARAQVAFADLVAGRGGAALSPPVTATLDATALTRRDVVLREIGFEIEPFGGRSFAIKRAPAGLPAADAPRMLTELLTADDPTPEALRWRLARRIAGTAPPLAVAERRPLLARLSGHTTPGGPGWIFALTAPELRRHLGHGAPGR
jgi:DNA mismatch repair protein MutL